MMILVPTDEYFDIATQLPHCRTQRHLGKQWRVLYLWYHIDVLVAALSSLEVQ